MTPRITPYAIAFLRAHPGAAGVAARLFVGLAAVGGGVLFVVAAIYAERALQRRAAR